MKKKAEDLKPGDVVVLMGTRVVLIEHRDVTSDREHAFVACRIGSDKTDTRYFAEDEEGGWEVESPTLSPAQQHAEELLELVRGYGKLSLSGWENSALELLARIDPPKPPSAEELAEALERALNSCGYSSIQEAQSVLDRARQAGMLKDPQ